jgi:hypothetical protein
MVGPLRRDKLVLIPMYAEMPQRPPPPRPFLNLLRSPVHLPLRPSCERFSDCPPLLSTHFLTPATGTCQATEPTGHR